MNVLKETIANSTANRTAYVGSSSNNIMAISKWYRMRYAAQKINQ